jgi:hypothetical protein
LTIIGFRKGRWRHKAPKTHFGYKTFYFVLILINAAEVAARCWGAWWEWAAASTPYGWVGHVRPKSVAAGSLTWFLYRYRGVTSNNGFWSVKFNYRRATQNPMWAISCPCGPFRVEKAQKTIGGSEFSPSHWGATLFWPCVPSPAMQHQKPPELGLPIPKSATGIQGGPLGCFTHISCFYNHARRFYLKKI